MSISSFYRSYSLSIVCTQLGFHIFILNVMQSIDTLESEKKIYNLCVWKLHIDNAFFSFNFYFKFTLTIYAYFPMQHLILILLTFEKHENLCAELISI